MFQQKLYYFIISFLKCNSQSSFIKRSNIKSHKKIFYWQISFKLLIRNVIKEMNLANFIKKNKLYEILLKNKFKIE